MTRRAAIILAGGKGERFQTDPGKWQDKSLAPLFGRPLLVRAVENVKAIVDEVVVCVNEEKRKENYSEVLRAHDIANVRLLVDERFDSLGGPLVAIFTGLKHLNADYCLTLPGDMPLVKPKVIEYMFERAKGTYVVVPVWPNGRLETLIMVLERETSLQIAETLCMLLRPRSDDIIRGTSNVDFVSTIGEISLIDPELKSFVNINSPQDLTKLQPRRVEGMVAKNLHVKRGSLPTVEMKQLRNAAVLFQKREFLEASEAFSNCAAAFKKKGVLFWTAVSWENEGKSLLRLSESKPRLGDDQASRSKLAFLDAASAYGLEAEEHEKCRCYFLADRARSDKSWCEKRSQSLN